MHAFYSSLFVHKIVHKVLTIQVSGQYNSCILLFTFCEQNYTHGAYNSTCAQAFAEILTQLCMRNLARKLCTKLYTIVHKKAHSPVVCMDITSIPMRLACDDVVV